MEDETVIWGHRSRRGAGGVKAFGALNRQYVIKVLLLLPFPFQPKTNEKKIERKKELQKYIETNAEIQ